MTQRATWDETWDDVAQTLKWRSLCLRARVGAVITDENNRVVSTGYNGPPAGFDHGGERCDFWCPKGYAYRDGHEDPDQLPCHSVHAEANAIISGDRSSWQGGTIYTTKHPCMECAKLIANSGLARLVVSPDPPALVEDKHSAVYAFLASCGVELELIAPKEEGQVVEMRRG